MMRCSYRQIDRDHEIAVLENNYETLHDAKGHRVLQPDYELIVIRKEGEEGGRLARKIVFSRTDLRPHEQFIYDEKGNLSTDARYANYKEYAGVNFPSRIEIYRPQEEYDITLNMLKLEINKPLKDEQFAPGTAAGSGGGASGTTRNPARRTRRAETKAASRERPVQPVII